MLADGAAQVSKGLPKTRDLLAAQARQLIMARDDWIFIARPWVLAYARRAAFESAEAVTQQLTAMFAVFASMPQTVVPSTAEQPGDALVRFLLDASTWPDAQSRLASLSPAERELVEQCQGPMFLLLSGQISSKDMAALLRNQTGRPDNSKPGRCSGSGSSAGVPSTRHGSASARRSHRWCSSGKNCKCRLRYRKPAGMSGVKIACVLWVAGCQVEADSIRGAYTLSSVTERTGR